MNARAYLSGTGNPVHCRGLSPCGDYLACFLPLFTELPSSTLDEMRRPILRAVPCTVWVCK
jgi:hypothetical protein